MITSVPSCPRKKHPEKFVKVYLFGPLSIFFALGAIIWLRLIHS